MKNELRAVVSKISKIPYKKINNGTKIGPKHREVADHIATYYGVIIRDEITAKTTFAEFANLVERKCKERDAEFKKLLQT